MTSPFLNASLSDLRDMAPTLSDPELDALAAAVCDGEWVRLHGQTYTYFARCAYPRVADYKWQRVCDYRSYTTDPREAMRLQEKYRISLSPTVEIAMGGHEWAKDHSLCWCAGFFLPNRWYHDNPCRAITLAAVAAGLTEMMEGNG